MSKRKWQFVLGAIACVLAGTIAVSVIAIVNQSGNKSIHQKKTQMLRAEYDFVDPDFADYIDDIIDDLWADLDDFSWSDDMEDDDPDDILDDESDSEEENVDDLDWLNDAENTDDTVYTSPIQMKGTSPAEADVRNIQIQTGKTVYQDFWGLGGDTFPEILSDDAVTTGYSSVAWEFERQKIISAGMNYTRALMDLDAIITNTEPDPQRDDYQNNSDYINYMSGIYDFENDSAKSFWTMMDALKEAGTLVQLNSGWKCAERIRRWYPDTVNDWMNSAPYDINAFIRANIAWLLECQDRGYGGDMLPYIYFGNEVNWGGDFKTNEDSIAYHTVLITAMVKAMDYARENTVEYCVYQNGNVEHKSGKLNKTVQMIAADYAPNSKKIADWTEKFNASLKATLGDKRPTGQSVHRYYNDVALTGRDIFKSRNYETTYSILNRFRETLGEIFINEFYASAAAADADYNSGNKEHNETTPGDWETSYASYFIAAANTGTRGLANWEYGTSFYPVLYRIKATEFADGVGALFATGAKVEDYRVTTNWRLASLLERYVPSHADVLQTSWEGEDIRTASFRLADGGYTFVVEAKKGTAERVVNLNLDKAVGKLYRYHYVDTDADPENRTLQGTLICSDKSFDSASKITDTIDKEYGVYVYSTKAPVEQIKLSEAVKKVSKGESVTIDAQLLDCPAGCTVQWEIAAASKENGSSLAEKDLMGDSKTAGTIITSGTHCTYQVGESAKSGDSIAVRATLLDPNGLPMSVYAVAIFIVA